MPRTTGSDTLYQLIHSLTSEEKGYFKKFAKRQLPAGNNYLRLFDAINAQKAFEEASLKKKFHGYADMKLYLKEIITDSLVLYHRQGHAHLQLFSQIEKIIVLRKKGLYEATMKALKSCIADCRKMELFGMERYLMSLQKDMIHPSLDTTEERELYHVIFKKEAELNLAKETDFNYWELLAQEWFTRSKRFGESRNLASEDYIKQVELHPTASTRSKLFKYHLLYNLYFIRDDVWKSYEISKAQMKLATAFKKNADPALNTVSIHNKSIKIALALHKHAEVLELVKTPAVSGDNNFNADLARMDGVIALLMTYFRTARFKDGTDFIKANDREISVLAARSNNEAELVHYKMIKVEFFLITKRFSEAWMVLEQIKLKRKPKLNKYLYAEWTFCRLLAQFGLNHFELLKPMAVKYEKVFRTLEMMDTMYEINFKFFKNVNSKNKKGLALIAASALKDYIQQPGTGMHRADEAQTMVFWFHEVAGGPSYEEATRQWLKRQDAEMLKKSEALKKAK